MSTSATLVASLTNIVLHMQYDNGFDQFIILLVSSPTLTAAQLFEALFKAENYSEKENIGVQCIIQGVPGFNAQTL